MALHVLGPANTLGRLFNTLSRLLSYHTGWPSSNMPGLFMPQGLCCSIYRGTFSLTPSLKKALTQMFLATFAQVSISFPSIHLLPISFLYFLPCCLLLLFLLYYAFYLFMLFPMCPPPAYKLHNSRVSFSCFSVLFTQYLEQCFSTFFPTVVPLNRIFQIFVFIAQLHY